jgi:chromosome segregation ATPase
MKRISIAESTLKAQIEAFYARREAITHQIDLLREQALTYDRAIVDLETEVQRLRVQRELASVRNKP